MLSGLSGATFCWNWVDKSVHIWNSVLPHSTMPSVRTALGAVLLQGPVRQSSGANLLQLQSLKQLHPAYHQHPPIVALYMKNQPWNNHWQRSEVSISRLICQVQKASKSYNRLFKMLFPMLTLEILSSHHPESDVSPCVPSLYFFCRCSIQPQGLPNKDRTRSSCTDLQLTSQHGAKKDGWSTSKVLNNVYIYMYVCMYVRTYVCMYVYVHLYINLFKSFLFVFRTHLHLRCDLPRHVRSSPSHCGWSRNVISVLLPFHIAWE